MSQVTQPVALVIGTQTTLRPPSPGALGAVVVTNLSPYLLAVTIDSDQYWQSPFEEAIYSLSHSLTQGVQILPRVLLSATVSPSAGAQVQATWYAVGEVPDGTWPISLPADAIVAQGSFVQDTLASATVVTAGNVSQAYDVSQYASVIFEILAGALPRRVLYQFQTPDGNVVSNGQLGAVQTGGSNNWQLGALGAKLFIVNNGAADFTFSLFGSNRPASPSPRPFLINDSGIINQALSVVTAGAGTYQLGVMRPPQSGQMFAEFSTTVGAAGYFQLFDPNGAVITVADTVEMHAAPGFNAVYKNLYVPPVTQNLQFVQTVAGAFTAAFNSTG